MARYYTRDGDDGYTGTLGKGRVPKYHPITEAVGTVDEASAALGMARAACLASQSGSLILAIQRDLYGLMAEVSASPENAARFRKVDAARVAWLEEQTDTLGRIVEMPKEFIVPGDSPAGAALALARTVVRRSERRIAELIHNEMVENVELLHYLNRLSSLCFVLELLENQIYGSSNPTLAKGSLTE
ncbi:MAG: cob(I)yrinic acid a,c-diamide adenosyltransferase [Chloroflexota bacterium]|nr:MAG: cob(I)yrinic acid a,c-diamide adenosyltransferase [Chloroflexota bacterium]